MPSVLEDDLPGEDILGGSEILYPHHVPTTWFQKGLLAVGSGLAAFFDPKRDG